MTSETKIDYAQQKLESSDTNTYSFDSWVGQCICSSCHYLVSSIFLESIGKEKKIKHDKKTRNLKKIKNKNCHGQY